MSRFIGGKNKMVILLALFGMVCWGIAPIFAKIGLSNANPLGGLLLRTMFAAGLVMGYGLLSRSITYVEQIPFKSWILIGIEAILATLVGDLAYYAAIKKGDVSLVTIIMSSSPLVTLVCAVIFLGEQVTVTRIIGAIFIMLGIAFII